MKNKIWILGVIILTIFLLLCLIYYINTEEGFTSVTCLTGQASTDENPCVCPSGLTFNASNICVTAITTSNSALRQNYTCSDPNQTYMYDRFSRAVISDMTNGCNWSGGAAGAGTAAPCRYENSLSNLGPGQTYELCNSWITGIQNLCLPTCPTGFTYYSKDSTLCMPTSNNCTNTADLSSNILQSWNQVCGPLMRMELNLTSTLTSISSVTSTLNAQYIFAQSNINKLSNYSYTSGHSNTFITSRDAYFPALLSSFNILSNVNNSTTSNYNLLNSAKIGYDNLYYSLHCDTYIP